MSKTSPTKRTLDALRKLGYDAAVVEQWIPRVRRRRDLFGFADIIAIRPGEVLAVQACSGGGNSKRGSDHGTHRAKILAHDPERKVQIYDRLRNWLEAGAKFEIWSWRKKDGRWNHKRERIGPDGVPARPLPVQVGFELTTNEEACNA